MEKKTMLLHLGSRGAVQTEMCFLIADKSIVMVLYQIYVFFAKKKKKNPDSLVQDFLVHLTTKDTEVTF